MINDKTLDILCNTMKTVPAEERGNCLSFLVANGFFGNDIGLMESLIYSAMDYPEDVLKNLDRKWRKRLKRKIDDKEQKLIAHNLQKFCDGAIIGYSISSACSELEDCCDEKKIISGDWNSTCSYKILFKNKVSQALLLSEIAKNVEKFLCCKEYHVQYKIIVKKFKVNAKFLPDDSLKISIKVHGVSNKGYKAIYSNVYHFKFTSKHNLYHSQRDRYDKIGRRLKNAKADC